PNRDTRFHLRRVRSSAQHHYTADRKFRLARHPDAVALLCPLARNDLDDGDHHPPGREPIRATDLRVVPVTRRCCPRVPPCHLRCAYGFLCAGSPRLAIVRGYPHLRGRDHPPTSLAARFHLAPHPHPYDRAGGRSRSCSWLVRKRPSLRSWGTRSDCLFPWPRLESRRGVVVMDIGDRLRDSPARQHWDQSSES